MIDLIDKVAHLSTDFVRNFAIFEIGIAQIEALDTQLSFQRPRLVVNACHTHP